MVTLTLALLLSQSDAHTSDRLTRLERTPGARVLGRNAGALGFSPAFAALTSTGGTNSPAAVCDGTTPAGLTFGGRASQATCAKQGSASTGIANGDLVSVASGVPRFELEGGSLRFLREEARTNNILRSEELDNAAWTLATSAVSPTITANDIAFSPIASPGSLPERLQVSAISGAGSFAVVYQGFTGTAATWTASCYVQGKSAAGSTYIMMTPGGSYISQLCNYPAAASNTWSRCSVTGTLTSAAWFLQIGTDLRDGAQSATSNVDVEITGCDVEVGAWPSAYIPTVSAAVGRLADGQLTATSSAIGPSFSMSANVSYQSTAVAATTAMQVGTAAPALASVGRSTDTAVALTINATSTTPAVSSSGTATHKESLRDQAGVRAAFWDLGAVTAPAASMVGTTTTVSFGALNARTGQICYDASAGCSP